MPPVQKWVHDFWEILIFYDDNFFFFLMDEAWPNAPSSKINVNFEKSYCVGTSIKKIFSKT